MKVNFSMKYISLILIPCTILFNACVFSISKLETTATRLAKTYADLDNTDLSWYCFIDQSVQIANQAGGSKELLKTLKDVRERSGALSVAWGLSSIKEEVQMKIPYTYKMLRQNYSISQLRTIVNTLIERNGKASCEKHEHKDDL